MRVRVANSFGVEAVRRIDALFDIEREINGTTATQRRIMRGEEEAPLVAELEQWMRAERAKLSRYATGPENEKIPHYISAADGSLLTFAGIWERWRNPEDGQGVVTCCIITREASKWMEAAGSFQRF